MSLPHPRRVRLLLGLLALVLVALVLAPAGRADEEEEPLDDSADTPVTFGDRINEAIERGVRWLIARPDRFETGRTKMAHWGLVKGSRIYGGGDGPQYRHPAGPTALALYTLLKCEVDPEHEVIEQGFNWLREAHTITEQYDGTNQANGWTWSHRIGRGSYELSAEILALCAKYDKYKRSRNTKSRRRRGRLRIRDRDDREWLEDMVTSLVERRGVPVDDAPEDERLGWRYNLLKLRLSNGRQSMNFNSNPPPHANQDLSSTQLAALALFNAHQFGVEAPEEVWLDIVRFTLEHQEEEGPEHERHDPVYTSGGYAQPIDHARGFMYIKGSPDGSEGQATGSMTACGIANLLMAKDVLLESRKGRREWEDRGYEKSVDKAIWDGLAWLDRNWSPFTNSHSRYGYHIYYLYALERAMDLLGKQLVGKHLWYREGALEILQRQKDAMVEALLEADEDADGPVPGVYWETGATHEPKDVLDTCFALLFLKRATADLVPGGVPVTGGDGPPADNR